MKTSLFSGTMKRMKRNVALFGFGRIGSHHFKNLFINPRVNLKVIVEDLKDKAETVLEEYHVTDRIKLLSSSEAEQVYADPGIDTVFVCTFPHSTHEEIIIQSLKGGKDVFCEKPITLTEEQTQRCYDVASENNKLLFCAFQKRFDPQLRSIYNRARNGDVGEIHKVKITSHEPSAIGFREYILNSGGVFIDTGVHDLDLMLWMMNERPLSVYVEGHAFRQLQRECNDIDAVAMVMKFPSGAIGMIDIDRGAEYGFDQRIEVYGTKGVMLSRNPQMDASVCMSSNGSHSSAIKQSFLTRWVEAYAAEVEHFLDVLEGTSAVEVNPVHSVYINRLAKACKTSYEEGRRVVMSELDIK